ncbi:MAG: peptidase M23 [Candidatus Dactylopiibacterium carminicum]|nr:MAG: peptidase M23 [Candidatus Dactylopiibacterium carminicum]
MQDYEQRYRVVWAGIGVLLLSACSTTVPAPVESRIPAATSAPVVSTPSAPVVARPGYHIVKRGETLYSIAHVYETDYRTLAAWNGIEDPAVIKAGQELRVQPPSGDMEGARPVEQGAALISRPVDGAPAMTSAPQSTTSAPAPVVPAGASSQLKTEPKGGRVAYSTEAWKDLTQPSAAASAPANVATSKPAEPPRPMAAQSAPATQSAPAAQQGGVAVNGEVEWSWPGTGRVIAGFNDSTNKGVDLTGNIGDPVLAAGAGRVVYVGSGLRGYGNLVIVKHNDTYLSAYAHNSEILVKEGQTVQRGQKIAALGNSDADRPKLHFEIRRQGKPVDPLKYLPTR